MAPTGSKRRRRRRRPFVLLVSLAAIFPPLHAYRPIHSTSLGSLLSLQPISLSSSTPTSNTTTTHSPLLSLASPTSLLSQLLVPRPPGSTTLVTLQTLLKSHFPSSKGWHTYEDKFTASTPDGPVAMNNLVFTFLPASLRQQQQRQRHLKRQETNTNTVPPPQDTSHAPWPGRVLILSAHIDSKISPVGFVGATDSAAPVAIIVDAATALVDLMEKRWEDSKSKGDDWEMMETLQVVFFDGEEAFRSWTHEDSIYGAKHLASLWSHPTRPPSPSLSPGLSTPLSRISTLILLDLLGAPNPSVPSFFPPTGWMYDHLVEAEAKLDREGLLWASEGEEGVRGGEGVAFTNEGGGNGGRASFFVTRRKGPGQGFYGGIEDDHLPFLAARVPILHLIPTPFPRVWHTMADDKTALDYPTVRAWSALMRVLVAEYLELPVEGEQDRGKRRDEL